MLRTPSLRVLVAMYARMLSSCAFTPDFPADAGLTAPSVSAVDARGEEVSLDRLPRRPRLRVTLPAQPPAFGPNMGPWLLRGACDLALLDDLAKLPLNAAHQSRSVAVRHRWAGGRLEIEPIDALVAGHTYTLALPRKAAMALPRPFTTELHVDASPLAGASLRATFPAAESAEVPADLAFALISFDGRVSGAPVGVWLEDERGLAHPAQSEDSACDDYDTAAVSCIRVRPTLPLQAASRYRLRSGRALTDAHGAAVSELDVAFSTQRQAGTQSASWQRSPCAVDEQELPFGCALLSDTSLELQLFQNPSVRVIARVQEQRIAQLPSATRTPIRFDALSPETVYALRFETFDASLNAEHSSWPLHTAATLPTLLISEINADPLGSEPEQEYVELWNVGPESVRLEGLLISDGVNELGTPIDGQVALPANARALLVSDSFDPADQSDVTPAAASLLVRMGKSVTRGGLANHGERLYLRTAAGQRVSSAPAEPPPREGQCLQRSGRDRATWELSACTPGQ